MVAAHAHCVVAHADELVNELATELAFKIEVAGEGAPLGDDQLPCENSGCLCNGALVGELTIVVFEQDDLMQWLTWELTRASSALSYNAAIAIDISENSKPFTEPATHFSGADARAILQSFQV